MPLKQSRYSRPSRPTRRAPLPETRSTGSMPATTLVIKYSSYSCCVSAAVMGSSERRGRARRDHEGGRDTRVAHAMRAGRVEVVGIPRSEQLGPAVDRQLDGALDA